VSRARNVGLKHAMSEWIAFLDSDDAWYRDKLKNQIEYLKRYPFYEILQSHEIWIRDGVRVNGCKHHKKTEGWIWELSLHRCLISPSGVLVKKALVERYGLFPEDFPVCEDYDLWLKIVRYHPVGLEPSLSIIKYGGHSDQLSRKYPAMDYYRVQTLFNLLKKEGEPAFQEKIIPVLIKKLHILINGAHKRQKFKQVESYKKLLQWIDNHDWKGSSILFQPLEFQTNQEIY
jgi:glycosyltransferase involved in cell wall biosynthesis